MNVLLFAGGVLTYDRPNLAWIKQVLVVLMAPGAALPYLVIGVGFQFEHLALLALGLFVFYTVVFWFLLRYVTAQDK
jgi:hypothetical protein